MMKLVATLVFFVAAASAQDLPTDGVALAISGYGVINNFLLMHFSFNYFN